MVGEDGGSDPNRNIYRVLDDDYVPVKDRPVAEEEHHINPHDLQSGNLAAGKDPYEPPRSDGSGIKAWAVMGAVLLVALLISVCLISGWVTIGIPGTGTKAIASDEKLGDFVTLSPSNGDVLTSNNVTMEWTTSQNAVRYEFMLDADPEFETPIKDVHTTNGSYSIYLTDGVYYWQVKAIGQGTESNWSLVKDFEVRTALYPPRLLSPMIGQVLSSTQSYYAWSAADHATLYCLQVDNDSDFSSPAIDIQTDRTEYSCTYRYEDGATYHWRVMALNGTIGSGWTSSRSFSVSISLSLPSLSDPSDGAAVTSDGLTLNWTDVPGAFIYRIQIDDSSDFSSPEMDVLTQTSDHHTTISSVNTTYYWRVMAMNEDYQSAWSPAYSFFEGYRYFPVSYSWSYGGRTFSFDLNISGDSYYQQQELNGDSASPYVQVDYAKHVNSTDTAVRQAAKAIKDIATAMGYDTENTLNLALAFVQTPNIGYGFDLNTTGHNDYARYPIETLVDKVGDCDCKSVLFLSLIQTAELGFDGVLLEYTGNPGHMAVGVAGSFDDYSYAQTYTYYTYMGQRYYYCETTGSGMVGQIPEGYSSAMIIPA
jgi:hypothetical protein